MTRRSGPGKKSPAGRLVSIRDTRNAILVLGMTCSNNSPGNLPVALADLELVENDVAVLGPAGTLGRQRCIGEDLEPEPGHPSKLSLETQGVDILVRVGAAGEYGSIIEDLQGRPSRRGGLYRTESGPGG